MNGVILVIRDGWGYRKGGAGNLIAGARTPVQDALWCLCPHCLLDASGEAVGVPAGYQGNSEVGHMAIGSGRAVFQSLERINASIASGEFYSNPALVKAIDEAKARGAAVHLVGLLQTEGVHSHRNHLYALLELCKRRKMHNVFIHVITDGRDAPVTASEKHLVALKTRLKLLGFGEIASLSGRYYTMDRDKRWERTRKAYDCIVKGSAPEFTDALAFVKKRHAAGETDEFLVPSRRTGYVGFKDNDSVVFWNFRTDRPRQFTQAVVEKKFDGWKRSRVPRVHYVGMTQYYSPMNASVAFPEQSVSHTLGKVLAARGLKQLRISETEKYAHVTFFFNCQRETPFTGEEHVLVPSPKVATYDLAPEMSARQVTDKAIARLANNYALVVVNLVNCDMVGHTGVRAATVRAIETVDKCTGRLVEAGLAHGYSVFVFADHGNAEDKSSKWETSHTVNPVPFSFVSNAPEFVKRKLKARGGLADVAPTVLEVLGLPKPKEMTGSSLLA
ncbi:MAG: 2,3-bisphosphoglycerate-independent phosphoglycerate mutase [Candidatus Micrarchaeia archaeon]